eukprot:CAMPEP_0197252602 /NCGR_PEP_ID=MMETSP1429-20130617/62070_1 /TAXON_ID=49237 /ORGANISM="Chaetoceros  sp., Strain UNC1202" /LENGTH=253 /DNA_ID=CAMNT_0042715029 /DNA_START=12 /DNA_END=773 /DNA_ORIENTATION=+
MEDDDEDEEAQVKDTETEQVEEGTPINSTNNDTTIDHDHGGRANDAAAKEKLTTAKILTNEEFFLDYTKDEYIQFASRTDILPPEPTQDAEEEENEASEQESDEEEEEEYNVESDEDDMEDEEECQIGMMNLILAQILKRFREENGRGPNTEELLAMRSALAEKLGIDESIINNPSSPSAGDESKKRRADDSNDGCSIREKRVKFTDKNEIKLINLTDEDAANDDDDDDDKEEEEEEDGTDPTVALAIDHEQY